MSVGVSGDLSSSSLYESLKFNAYCEGYWAKLHSYLNLPLRICPDDPVVRLRYALQVLAKAASVVYATILRKTNLATVAVELVGGCFVDLLSATVVLSRREGQNKTLE